MDTHNTVVIEKLTNPEKYPDYHNESNIISVCVANPSLLHYVVNQTETICWAVLVTQASAIRYIRNPTDIMVNSVLLARGDNIKHLRSPTLNQCEVALKRSGALIVRHIANQPEGFSDLLVDFLLENSDYRIQRIKNVKKWSETAWKKILKEYPLAILFIEGHTEEMYLYAFQYIEKDKDNLEQFFNSIDIEPTGELLKELNRFKLMHRE